MADCIDRGTPMPRRRAYQQAGQLGRPQRQAAEHLGGSLAKHLREQSGRLGGPKGESLRMSSWFRSLSDAACRLSKTSNTGS